MSAPRCYNLQVASKLLCSGNLAHRVAQAAVAVFEEASASQPSMELRDLHQTFLAEQLLQRLAAAETDNGESGPGSPAATEAIELSEQLLEAYEASANAGAPSCNTGA